MAQRRGEMDTLESFWSQFTPGNVWHTNSVGGHDNIDYTSRFAGLTSAGLPQSFWDLTKYHTFTWLYLRDDTYKVFVGGDETQSSTLHWTDGAAPGGANIDVVFLFDFGWGHTQVSQVNIEVPVAQFPGVFEIDYSRVFVRD